MQITKMYNAIFPIYFITLLLILSGCQTQSFSTANTDDSNKETIAETPADAQIKAARTLVEKNPEMAESYVKLAAAILKKVRETGDYGLNREAEISINNALELDTNNFSAQFLIIQIHLSEHEFGKALELAEKLEKDNPNSEPLLAAITDAKTELGRYEEAVEAAQKFVNFRPNANSYARVAHLRSLHGDTDGAIEAYKLALRISDPDDKEILAWHHSRLGNEFFQIGRFSEAEREFDLALEIFPEYHWALAGKGKVRAAHNDLETAARIYEKLTVRTSETERAIFLGDIYKKLGRDADAQKIYDETVRKQSGGDMHRLALFWADHDTNLDEALKIAGEDRQNNADLLASDTLAWCLYKTGKYKEAKKYIAEAMRLKTKSALFFYHAGMIENALGNRKEAVKYLKLSLATNPSFDLLQADIAKDVLAKLESPKG